MNHQARDLIAGQATFLAPIGVQHVAGAIGHPQPARNGVDVRRGAKLDWGLVVDIVALCPG